MCADVVTVKLQGNAINNFMSNASIVDFFATMIGTSIIDIFIRRQVLQRLGVCGLSCCALCGIDADCHAKCMAAGAQRVAPTVV